MSSRLTDKIALVTGGSRGIGAATARHLAAQGATVAITYNSSPERAQQVVAEIERAGGKAQAFHSNASNATAAATLADALRSAYGHLDILVNNAGAFAAAPIAESNLDTYSANFDINVRGVHEYTRAVLPLMRDGGRIITVGSGYGNRPQPGTGAYAATKAAVVAFGKAWAKELAPRKITVNTVSPGSINTEMNPSDSNINPSADGQRAGTPLGHFGTPDDIAAAVTFLAGPSASFITGANIPVDGGYTA